MTRPAGPLSTALIFRTEPIATYHMLQGSIARIREPNKRKKSLPFVASHELLIHSFFFHTQTALCKLLNTLVA